MNHIYKKNPKLVPKYEDLSGTTISATYFKFMFSKKATKIDEIFTVDLTLCSKCQIDGEDFVNFFAFLENTNFNKATFTIYIADCSHTYLFNLHAHASKNLLQSQHLEIS